MFPEHNGFLFDFNKDSWKHCWQANVKVLRKLFIKTVSVYKKQFVQVKQ